MTRPEAINLAGYTVYTRPYPTRVSIRLRENAVATGLPPELFAELRKTTLYAISVDRSLAQQVSVSLLRSASRYLPSYEVEKYADYLAAVRVAEDLEGPIAALQQLVAVAYVRARYRKRVVRHIAVLPIAAFLHSVAIVALAPVAGAFLKPLYAALALGLVAGLAASAFALAVDDLWPFGSMTTSAAVATTGSALQVLAPSAFGGTLLFVGSALVLASFVYWEVEAKKRFFSDPAPPANPLISSPHLHWHRAIAPAWYGNRKAIPDTANFVSPEALWRHFRASVRGPYFPWAGVRMPVIEAYGNVALLGAPQSGKTKLIEIMMRGLLPHSRRALVYDPKRLFVPVLSSIFGHDDVALSYVFDERATVWNIAHDVDSEARAATFARARIPDRADQNGPYWTQSARSLLVAIIIFLQLVKPHRWTLRDLVAATDREYLNRVLQATEYGRYQYEQHLKIRAIRDSGRPDSVIAGLSGALEALQPVAAAHDYHMKAGRFFSVRDWISGTGPRCIVFSRDREHGAALDPMNQTLFDYVAMMLLDNPVSKREPDTFAFLDELQEASELSALQELLSNGRERGVSTILSAQSVTALAARYGAERAKTIIDLCRNHGFLRLDSPETAELASKLCGLQYFVDVSDSGGTSQSETWGHTSGPHSSSSHSVTIGTNRGWQRQIRSEPLVSPGTLLELPGPSKEMGLAGLFRQEDIRAFHLLSPTWIDDHAPARSDDPAYVPLDSEITGRFKRWTKAEFLSLAAKSRGARSRGFLERFFDKEPEDCEE